MGTAVLLCFDKPANSWEKMFQKYKSIISILLLALVYFVCASLSVRLAFENTNASPIWPPSGLAFAAVIIMGRRALWGIFIGALAINLQTFSGNHAFSANIALCTLIIGIGNTLEAYLGERFLRSFSGNERNPLSTYQTYFIMLMVTFVSCLAGAVIGAGSLMLNGLIPADLFKAVFITWWIGDYVGVLIIAPLLLSFANRLKYQDSKEKTLEFAITLIIMIGLNSVIFGKVSEGTILSELSFIILPFFLWIVYRFSVLYISITVVFVSFIAVFGTVGGNGPFVREELNESLLLLQVFMGIISVTFVALSITLNSKNEVVQKGSDENLPMRTLWFIGLSFIISLTISLFIIQEQERKNNALVQAQLAQKHDELTKSINDQMEYILEALDRMAGRRSFDGLQGMDEWQNDAKNYYEDFGIFKALEWVDSSNRVRWVYPLKGNENASGVNLSFEPKRKKVLELARSKNKAAISEPIDLLQGGRGILMVVPVRNEDKFLGYILGVSKLNEMFKHFLGPSENDYFIQIHCGDVTAFKSKNFYDNFFKASKENTFKNFKWNLTLVPRPAFLQKLGKESNTFSIIIGFLISVLISLVVYLIIYARYRAQSLFRLNENLLAKNEELKKEKEISQQAAVAKSDFLANMSHEIRTPMNGVLGALQLAMDSRDSEIRNYLKVIDISAKNLMDIINDILDYSKIEAGKLTLEVISFDLKKLIHESLIIVEGKAKSQKVKLSTEFNFETDKNFKGDPVRVRQILLNLLSNAVKFTTEGTVSVKTYMNEAAQVCIEVTDSGIGIPIEKQEHIFDQFSQADTSTTREYGGTGLGLAITNQLVKLMDGKIEVESKIGEGTTFKVTLPLEQTDIILVESAVDLERRYGKRVLLCEDNKTNQLVIKEILIRLGIEVEIVENGKDALELIDTAGNDFDLIFMDLHMPMMDGFQSTSEILKLVPESTIIALTANVAEEDRKMCFEYGMKGYLTKPIQKSLLVSELDKWFGKAS